MLVGDVSVRLVGCAWEENVTVSVRQVRDIRGIILLSKHRVVFLVW